MNNQPRRTVHITPEIAVGADNPLLLIAGPCQIESLEHTFKIAGFLKSLAARHKIQLVFKSSYDKANRTSISGARGLGIDAGLKVLEKVRSEFDIPVLTDIHTAEEASAAGAVVDVLQTPAFLCRQTDLLLAAGSTGKAVNVKKGQFLAPEDMAHVAAKIASTGNHNIMLCERGTCFGYRDLVVDMRAFPIMRSTGYPVIFDGTHSVQSMGGKGGSSGGHRESIAPLVRAASAVGIDGLFLECHDCPEKAPSDGASMLELEQLDKVIESAIKIRSAISNT